MMKKALHGVAKLGLLFFGTLALFVLLLVCVALIPRDAIRENMLKTAEHLCERSSIFKLVPEVQVSTLDRYADSVLMSLVYYWDENSPLESTMRSNFYGDWTVRQNELLLDSVRDGRKPNQEYLRYWHGSGVLLRPLLLVCSIREVYALCAIALCALLAWLLVTLHKNGMDAEAGCVCLSLAAVSVWFVPFCLEYVWVFLIALAASCLCVRLALNHKHAHLIALFMLTGMITAYFDFLTSETLTLTIPLLLAIRSCAKVSSPSESPKRQWGQALGCGVLWFVGYVGAWTSKWAIASLVLRTDAMPYVSDHVAERLNKYVGLEPMQYLWQALERNLTQMSPLQYGQAGIIVAIALAMGLVAFILMRGKGVRKAPLCWSRILLFFLIGLVPYIRYLALHAHAWQHAGFTYRAQAATVLAVCFIALELLGILQAAKPEEMERTECLAAQ